MFKKRCSKCTKKVSKTYDFCPYCGGSFEEREDYGLLGKTDDLSSMNKALGNSFGPSTPGLGPMGGMGFMEKLLGNAIKMLDKEIRNISEEESKLQREEIVRNPNIKSNFQLFINGKKVNLPENFNGDLSRLRIAGSPITGNMAQEPTPKKQKAEPKISDQVLKNSVKLPRKEAKTKLIRYKDKVIYELDTPGLDNVDNVLVNKLENSLEIKAYAAKAVYFKNLAVKLPLMKYGVSPEEGKLVLEFKAQ